MISIARGEKHSAMPDLQERNVDRTIPATIITPAAGESLLAVISNNEWKEQKEEEKGKSRSTKKGPRRVVIGPLHEDYGKSKSSEEDSIDDTSSEAERNEVAKKLSIFDVPISGPDPKDALIRPALLPFAPLEKWLAPPCQFINAIFPSPNHNFSPSRYREKMTIANSVETMCEILRECVEKEGGSIQEVQKQTLASNSRLVLPWMEVSFELW